MDSNHIDTEAAIDVVTRFAAALAVGDIESSLALVHENLIFSEAPSLPFGGDRIGSQGLQDLLAAISRDYRIRLGQPTVTGAGDRVLVRVQGTIASRATGRQMPLEALDLYDVRDGLIQRVDVFYKDAAAVTALCEPLEATMTGSLTS